MNSQRRTSRKMEPVWFHWFLHLFIGLVAGAVLVRVEGALLWGGGGVAHLEGSHLFKKYVLGDRGDPMHDWQNIIVRGSGLVIGIGLGRLLRYVLFGSA